MKLLTALIIFTSISALAASDDDLLKNEKIEEQFVFQNFNLRASDGSVVEFSKLSPAQLVSVSIIGKTLQFITNDGRAVNFAITSLPKRLEKFSDLYMMAVNRESSGQNLGVDIYHSDDNTSLAPTTRTTSENCTIRSEVKTCDHLNRCTIQTVTQNGRRQVTTTTQFILKNYSVVFSTEPAKFVYSGTIGEGEFVSSRNEGPCFP